MIVFFVVRLQLAYTMLLPPLLTLLLTCADSFSDPCLEQGDILRQSAAQQSIPLRPYGDLHAAGIVGRSSRSIRLALTRVPEGWHGYIAGGGGVDHVGCLRMEIAKEKVSRDINEGTRDAALLFYAQIFLQTVRPLKPLLFGNLAKIKISWHALPIGVLFGFKLGLTNWGLHLAPTVNFHLLIQASSVSENLTAWHRGERLTVSMQLFFVILFAFFILREQPTIWALLCAAGATAGAILVSLQFEKVSRQI